MVSKFARTIVYTVLGVAYHVQASDKTCLCTNGVGDTTCEAETDKKCKTCNEGYFLAGTHCEACSAGDFAHKFPGIDSNHKVAFMECKKCDAGGKCTEVKSDASYLASHIATKCHDGCSACEEATKCKANSANDGWFLDDKKPTECADGCKKCTEAEKCTTGENEVGFRLDADKKPEACAAPGCSQCDDDKAQCAEAKPGYWKDGTTVGECAANCAVCTKTECTTAAVGYIKKSGETAVDACAANCRSCAEKDKCTTPEEGFYVNDEETTTACTAGCATCDKATTTDKKCLTALDDGWLLDAEGKPHECPTGCNTCQAGDNTDKTKCDANGEKIGYFLKDSKPTACETGCAKCTDATTCLIPLPTHFRNDEDKLAVCGEKCELCLGKTCIKEKDASSGGGSGDNVSGSVSSALSMVVAFAVGIATIS